MTNQETDKMAIMKSVLDGIETRMCACDVETFDLLFINDSLKDYFGIKDDVIGQKCYKALQKLDAPCPNCPYKELQKEPDKTINWEHIEVVNNSILRKTAKLIDWPDGRKAHLEYAIDITELRQKQGTIERLESEVAKIYYDSLTGIFNRRYFDEFMKRITNTLSRSNEIFSLLMADIDFFKKYNDTYGHVKGDECLKKVAEIIIKSINRKGDFVARYGGEEFVIVLPNTDEKGARLIANKIINGIRNCNIPHEENGEEKRVTISIGVTTGKWETECTAEDFIQRADNMLYESKRNGRNKYTFASL